ncbi:MAG: hypothetical protein ABIX28_16690 [Vicinamibacterales bacterium]
MTISKLRTCTAIVTMTLSTMTACRTVSPNIRFAPPGTAVAQLRSDFPLTPAERQLLTPESLKALTQDQVDQIYLRLSSGRIPDGPFRGDLFFPRDSRRSQRVGDLVDQPTTLRAPLAAMHIEHLGRLLWKGKAFFRAQGVLRNRIDDLAILKPIFTDSATIPKMTFDGETTWLLFPAALSCGASRFDPSRRSVTIDYSRGPTIEGYRPIPDELAGEKALNIFDEVRIVRPGLYLGRAYFGQRFGLNFTLLDPAIATGPSDPAITQEECDGGAR